MGDIVPTPLCSPKDSIRGATSLLPSSAQVRPFRTSVRSTRLISKTSVPMRSGFSCPELAVLPLQLSTPKRRNPEDDRDPSPWLARRRRQYRFDQFRSAQYGLGVKEIGTVATSCIGHGQQMPRPSSSKRKRLSQSQLPKVTDRPACSALDFISVAHFSLPPSSRATLARLVRAFSCPQLAGPNTGGNSVALPNSTAVLVAAAPKAMTWLLPTGEVESDFLNTDPARRTK